MKTAFCFAILAIVYTTGNELNPTSSTNLSRCPSAVKSNEDPKYMRRFGNKCYEFVIYQERYWDQANSACASKKGHLVTIPDNYTQEFLMRTLEEMDCKKHGIWIGLNDRRSEGTFEWESGAALTYTYWKDDSPPAHTFINSADDCFTMRRGDSWKWEDYHCHLWPQHYGYICEYDIDDAPTKAPCPVHKQCSIDCSRYGFKVDARQCPLCQCNTEIMPVIAIIGK